MAFDAGAVIAHAKLDTAQWEAASARLKKGVNKLGSVLNTAAKVGFVGAAAAIGIATKKSMEFDKEVRNVTTLIKGTPKDFDNMRKSLLNLDSSLGTSKEMAAGLYQAISAGAEPGAEAMQLVEQSAKFAKAALTDTNTAVDIITTAMNAYGKETISAAQASDLYFTTIKEGKITGEELSAVIGQSIPLFASAGIGMEELTAGMAAMTKQGVQASETTTQMNSLVRAFIKPSTEMGDALKDIGYHSGAAFLEAKGLSGAMEFLQKQTKGEKDELAKLIPDIQGIKGALALTGKGAKIFNDTLTEMENITGATTEAFKKQIDPVDLAGQTFDKLAVVAGQAGEVLLDELAVAATEAAKGMIDFIKDADNLDTIKTMASDLAKRFIDLAKFTGKLVKIIVDLPAPIKAAAVAGVALAAVVPKLVAGFKAVKIGIIAMKSALIVMNTIALLGPTGIIVLAGMAAAALFMLGKQHYDNVKSAKQERLANLKLKGVYTDLIGETDTLITSIGDVKKNFVKFKAEVTGGNGAVNALKTLKEQLKTVEGGIIDLERITGKSTKTQKDLNKENKNFVLTQREVTQGIIAQVESQKNGISINKTAEKQHKNNIKELNKLQWQRQELIQKINEMEAAIKKEKDAINEETESNKVNTDVIKANQEARENIQDLRVEMLKLQGKENDSAMMALRLEEQRALKKIQLNKDISDSVKTDLIQTTKNYYKLLRDDTALSENEARWLTFTERVKETSTELGTWLVENFKTMGDAVKAGFDAVMQGIQWMLNSISSITSQHYKNENAKINLKYKNDQKALKQNLKNGVITQKEYDKKKTQLDEDLAKKKNNIAKKQFKAEKGTKIGEVWINAALATMKVWQAYAGIPFVGPVIAGIMTGVIAGVATIQTALIGRQKFVPQYAKGGRPETNKPAIVGEKGPEMFIPDTSGTIIPNDITEKVAAGGGGNTYLQIYNPVIREDRDIDKLADKVSRVLGKKLAFA